VNGGPEPRELMKIEHVLADLIVAGVSIKRASRELNLGHDRVASWIHRGRAGNSPYSRLVESIEAAETEHEQNLREAIEAARERLRRMSA
jgi:hypothetical protein